MTPPKKAKKPFDPQTQCALCLGPDPLPGTMMHANTGKQPHRWGGYCAKCKSIFTEARKKFAAHRAGWPK